MELQKTRYLRMKGVLDSIELRMLRTGDYLPTQSHPTQVLMALRSFEPVTIQGCYGLSDSLLSLAFTTEWNPKHPAYVSTRLFFKSSTFALKLYFL